MDDKKANREPYYILRNNEVQQVLCKNIFPGDVVWYLFFFFFFFFFLSSIFVLYKPYSFIYIF